LEVLRTKQLFKLTSDQVGRIIYNVHGKVVDMVLDSAGQWHFADDKKTKVAGYKVTQNVTDLTNLKAVLFFDRPTSPALTGLDNPYLRLTLAAKDGKTTQTIITGKKDPKDNFVYARMVDSGLTVGIDWQEPGKFFVARDDLYDKSIFDFDRDAVEKVEIKEKDKKLSFSKMKSGGWTATNADSKQSYQVDATRMSPLIYITSAMKYARRLDPIYPNDLTLIKTQSLENPSREIIFFDKEGTELGRLGIGGNSADKNASSAKYVYIRRNQKDYYAVDKDEYFGVNASLQDILNPSARKKMAGGPGMAFPDNPRPE
jgi:hypothetical protein